ncbi:MAG TPA: hypothetical protein VKE22_16675 [Haliangiales bacterium]|nr:hypothetical protein [Haliangiales bacterium]
MKLRIRGNTLRYRLTQGEVAALAEGRAVAEEVNFGNGLFTYEILPEDGASGLDARASAWRISVVVPGATARQWNASDDVGLSAETSSGIKLLVEKDFACLKPRAGEDDADAFPNPGTC